jgi:hypothetical protein
MPRKYTVVLSPAAATAALDLVELKPADDIPVRILGFRVWQTSDLGDAAEEIITLSWVRGNTSDGTGGNGSVAVSPASAADAAASATCRTGDTTAASSGTAVTLYSTGWNVRAPLEVVFTPQQQLYCSQGQTMIVLRMGAAPADSLTIGCSVDLEEII